MSNPCLDAVSEELEAAGVPFHVNVSGRHVHISYGDQYQHLHVVAKTPSDHRAHLNERAQIRRDLAKLGYIESDASLPASPLVTLRDGSATVASYHIADHFSKAHKDVLRTIDRIREECGLEFDRRNFTPIDYVDAKGRKYRAYSLTRDGFTLVVMGFTGRAATEWKIKYIDAFNALETEVRALASPEARFAELRGELDAAMSLIADVEAKLPQPVKVKKPQFIRPSVLRRMRRMA